MPDGLGGQASNFGYSISISGDRALVGAPDTASIGVAYVFEFDGSAWVESQVLRPDDGEGGERFGFSVSLFGNRALIGAFGDDGVGADSGSAYLFEFSGGIWSQVAKLVADDEAAEDYFGYSVSLSNLGALVGAYENDENGIDAGSAYLFGLSDGEWTQAAKLTSDGDGEGERFGASVSLSGSRALIGAYTDGENGIVSGSAYIFDLSGGNWLQTAKLIASDGAVQDYFGQSVSLSGDRALVGAFGDDDNGSYSGSAYIFDLSGGTWSQTAKLVASDGVASDNFGSSVSLTSGRALVGAWGNDSGADLSGAAYLFDLSDGVWSQTAKLRAEEGVMFGRFGWGVDITSEHVLVSTIFELDGSSVYAFGFSRGSWVQSDQFKAGEGAALDQFAFSVSLSGDRALVGAHLDDDNGTESGSAYVFEQSGGIWSQTAKLTAEDGAAYDNFGISVSLSGGRALVGAYGDDENGTGSGSVYVFELSDDSWSQTAKLSANDGTGGDRFGWSVSVQADRALVGAAHDSDIGTGYGSAYIFDLTGTIWTQTVKLMANDGATHANFGISVSLSQDRALVGARRGEVNGIGSGAAYLFEFDNGFWSQTAILAADDGASGDQFGYSVSLFGARALIGAYLNEVNGIESGSAYVFDLIDDIWTQTAKLSAGEGDAGDQFGTSVSLYADQALVGAFADDDHGTESGSAYLFGLSNGTWTETSKLTAIDGVETDYFGFSVALSDRRSLISAFLDDDRGTDSGSVYVFFQNTVFADGFEN